MCDARNATTTLAWRLRKSEQAAGVHMCGCVMAAREAGEAHRNALVTQRHKIVCGGTLFASMTLALSSAYCKRAGAGLLVVLRHGCRQLSLCSFELGHGTDTARVCDAAG